MAKLRDERDSTPDDSRTRVTHYDRKFAAIDRSVYASVAYDYLRIQSD